MIQGSLLYLWMHKCSKQQSNLQLLPTEKLTNLDESTLTENDAKSLSKAPCLVALNMYLTLHLLLFG